MVNDVGGEDLDVFLCCEFDSIRHDSHVEGQNSGKLFLLLLEVLFGFAGLQDILFEDGANVDSGNWDLHLQEEFKQSFEGADCGCLHTDTILSFVNVFFKNVNKIRFDLLLCLFNFMFVHALEELRASNSAVEIRS